MKQTITKIESPDKKTYYISGYPDNGIKYLQFLKKEIIYIYSKNEKTQKISPFQKEAIKCAEITTLSGASVYLKKEDRLWVLWKGIFGLS